MKQSWIRWRTWINERRDLYTDTQIHYNTLTISYYHLLYYSGWEQSYYNILCSNCPFDAGCRADGIFRLRTDLRADTSELYARQLRKLRKLGKLKVVSCCIYHLCVFSLCRQVETVESILRWPENDLRSEGQNTAIEAWEEVLFDRKKALFSYRTFVMHAFAYNNYPN